MTDAATHRRRNLALASLLALPLLLVLVADVQAQRRGFSRSGTSSSVRQSRSSSQTTSSRSRETSSRSRDRDARSRDRDRDARSRDRVTDRSSDRARRGSSVRQSRGSSRARDNRQDGRQDDRQQDRRQDRRDEATTLPARPRVGDRYDTLPSDPTKLYVNKKRHWYHHGRFYRKVYVGGDSQYEVVVAPVGAMVNEIPDDCEEVVIDDLIYFDCLDVWFKEVEDGGRTRYMVVEAPA